MTGGSRYCTGGWSTMRLCNDTITVVNAAYDSATDLDVFIPPVLNGCSWFLRDNAAVEPSGLKNASTVVVRIPADNPKSGMYVDPIAYAALSDKSGHWTLQAGDIIVKAAVTGTDLRPQALAAAYPDVITVLSVTDNRRAPKEPHWKVTGA